VRGGRADSLKQQLMAGACCYRGALRQTLAAKYVTTLVTTRVRTEVVPALWRSVAAFQGRLAAGMDPTLLPWTLDCLLQGLEAAHAALAWLANVLHLASAGLGTGVWSGGGAGAGSAYQQAGCALRVRGLPYVCVCLGRPAACPGRRRPRRSHPGLLEATHARGGCASQCWPTSGCLCW
jgi:hypothetical protein